MSSRREKLLAAVTVGVTVIVLLGAAEIVLRFLPVATGMRTVAVSASSPVFHFAPNRNFLFLRDWDMIMANRGHINNAGFVND